MAQLLVEMVLPEGEAPHPGKLLDMVMLTAPGGEERTALAVPTAPRAGWLPDDARGANGLGRKGRRSHAAVNASRDQF